MGPSDEKKKGTWSVAPPLEPPHPEKRVAPNDGKPGSGNFNLQSLGHRIRPGVCFDRPPFASAISPLGMRLDPFNVTPLVPCKAKGIVVEGLASGNYHSYPENNRGNKLGETGGNLFDCSNFFGAKNADYAVAGVRCVGEF